VSESQTLKPFFITLLPFALIDANYIPAVRTWRSTPKNARPRLAIG
jgi:hypothetical protein